MIQKGSSRKVVLIGRWAIKLPYFVNCGYGRWYGFLTGLRNNIVEYNFSRCIDNPILCPVVFHLPLGLMNIMPRCIPLTEEEFAQTNMEQLLKQTDFVFIENKADSWGKHENKIVAIDYH